MDEMRYYNSSITLEEAERYIQGGLITAARAYVANGYYLRRIRDDKLFEEAGYQNFEDYVRGKYNKDKGWASKCIKVNQQLSEGGNSPILSNQYLEYSTYQLVELAYMTEEQREEADPDMTVNQLKQIRKPEEAIEPEKSCDVTTSEPEEEIEPEQINDDSIPCDSCQHELGLDGGNDCETCSDYESFEQKQEPEEVSEPNCPEFYNPDDEKEVDESYSMANIPRASDRHVTMFARLFVQDNTGMLFHDGVFYGIRDDEIIRMLKLGYHARKENPIMIDNDVEVSVGAEIIEFSRGDEDLGICLFQKFANYVHDQINEYISEKAEEQRKNQPDSESEEPGGVPESFETVIDGEFVEVHSDLSSPVKTILEKEKKTLQEWLRTFEGEVPEKWPSFIERQKIIVAALEAMAEEQERLEYEQELEPEKQEQPELPILKNNDQRAAFVDAYETWPLWIETMETGERYYRYDLPDGTSIVVKVYHAMLFKYKGTGEYENRFHEGYGRHEYYLLREGKFFRDCETNRSNLVDVLKELQKKK